MDGAEPRSPVRVRLLLQSETGGGVATAERPSPEPLAEADPLSASSQAPPARLDAGHRVGSYEIVSLLGDGAMGTVYRAIDHRLGRDVALKILHSDLTSNRQMLERFKLEAHSASSLNHPNVVTIHEIGENDGLHFIAMEYVHGERLRDLMCRGDISLRALIGIVCGVADGLAAAHARGIIHRDLKPENLMVSSDCYVKILDFGLAKPFQGECAPTGSEQTLRLPWQCTDHGTVVGTPCYMSPEQVSGEPVDHRSDQFTLGVLVFELMARQRPFDRPTTVETMTSILRDAAPRLSSVVTGVPDDLERIVERCLSKQPGDRYSATADLAHDLHELRDALLPRFDQIPRQRRKTLTRPLRATATLLAALLVVLLGSIAGMLYHPQTSASESSVESLLPERMDLVILPFEDLSRTEEGELFARGMTEMIAARLSGLSSLQVIHPAEVESIDTGLAKIAREHGANLVMKGSVRWFDDEMRISYRVVNPVNNVQVVAGTVDGSMRNPFLMEDRLATSIVQALERGAAPHGVHESNDGVLEPADQEIYLRALGLLHRYEDEPSVDLALEHLGSLHLRAPDSQIVSAALGRAFLYKFQLTKDRVWADQAVAVSEAVLEDDPRRPEVHSTYGEVLMGLGRKEEAVLQFRRALSIQPDFAQATIGLAEALDKLGRDEEAKSAYERAISLRPQFAGNYNKLGIFHYRRGRIDEAIEQLRKAIELTPDSTRALNNLGVVLMNQGRYGEASVFFRKSLDVSETGSGWSNLGTVLYYGGKFEEAVDAFSRATEHVPDNYLYWMNLADALRWTPGGDQDRMVRAYERAIQLAEDMIALSPGDARVLVALGVMHAKNGRSDLARHHVQSALSILPADPDVLLAAAIAMHVTGDDENLTLLARAIDSGLSATVLESEPELRQLRDSGKINRLMSNRT